MRDEKGRNLELKIVTCNFPIKHINYIKKLIEYGLVPSRSEYVRRAVGNQIADDLKTKRYVEDVMVGKIKLDPSKYIKIPGYNGDKPVEIIRRLDY